MILKKNIKQKANLRLSHVTPKPHGPDSAADNAKLKWIPPFIKHFVTHEKKHKYMII